MTPDRFQPGIGLRPGGERPDLEPLVVRLYRAMYEAIAAHSRLGINVIVDAVHHDAYSVPRHILRTCARQLHGLPVLLVGVRCPVEVVLERRRATWGGIGYNQDGTVQDPVQLWHDAVHQPGIYDLEVDTSVLRPQQSADLIARRLHEVRAHLAGLPTTSPLAVVEAFLAAVRPVVEESARGSGCAVAAVTVELDGDSADLRSVAAAAFASWTGQLASLLAAAGMAPDDAGDLASLLVNLLEGAHVLCRAAGSPEPFDRAARAAVVLTGVTSARQATQ